MRLYRHEADLPPDARGAVLTLGNFDGVHLGHQAVIAEALRIARAAGRPLGVLTFEPHTKAFFRPDMPPFRLTPLRVKLHALEALGVDYVVALAFDETLAAVSAEAFAADVLARGLGISHAVAGGNFRYGYKHARHDGDAGGRRSGTRLRRHAGGPGQRGRRHGLFGDRGA